MSDRLWARVAWPFVPLLNMHDVGTRLNLALEADYSFPALRVVEA